MDNKIGNRITELRKKFNMSQEALAERVGVSRQAISKWERGEANPDINKVMALAETFNLSIDSFIYGGDSTPNIKQHIPKIINPQLKSKAEKMLIIGVAIMVISIFMFNSLPFSNNTNILIFGLMITTGILLSIKSGFMFESFNMLNKNTQGLEDHNEPEVCKQSEKRRNSLTTAVALLSTAVYLYISLAHGLWHPGWVVFLFIPAAYALYDVFNK
ncbi:helix-turn-helix domain-containing protein [Clostridium sp. 'deep sea']|uniref:helix-turn-helix transcriptional regulator n=1 Tax=Clostridium sp. 'deep sea' TaxID=2779445 RepID=UPI00189654BF|nr:helix-turn-helix domain-containing protein [Clostridium sp. 'deep sea']QOR35258.1 helix-turn-helix domain-containing protein [Clostridium sp. 'deep sea']